MLFDDFIMEMLPFLMIPVAFAVLSRILVIVKDLAKGCYISDMKEELEKRFDNSIKEEETRTKNIDKDLEKYFNYKE